MALLISNTCFSPLEECVPLPSSFYIEGNDWQDGKIAGFDCYGASFELNAAELPRLRSNVLALGAVGLTAQQTAYVLGARSNEVGFAKAQLRADLVPLTDTLAVSG